MASSIFSIVLFVVFLSSVSSYPATQQQQRPPSTFLGPDKQGCFWSRQSTESPILDKLECHLRTLTPEFWRGNVSAVGSAAGLGRDQLLRVKSLQLRCNDKLLFDSFLSPNQSLFAMSNVESVVIDGCKIRNLPGNVWATLSFLRSLQIRTRNGDWSSSSVSLDLANEAFNGLTQLVELDLSENNIWSVPDRLFCPLRSLTKLNISRNRLSELEEFNGSPEANYCMLNSVSSVDASWNGLRRIGRIVKWKKIQQLRLDHNLIEELDDGAFGELTQLKFVNLSSNRLVALPPTIFKYNGMLREVHLSNNTISALAPAVFSSLFGLMKLDMSRNTLTSQWIREKMFNGLGKLVVLNLSFNQLSYIDAGIFKDLVNLQFLSLDNNRIESVHPEAFGALGKLQVLDLSYNRLQVVDAVTFGGLAVIKRLYLDHNKIRTLPEELLVNCTSLQDLGLADNLLQEVPPALRIGLTALETLDIGENRITSLTNDSFLGLHHLFGLRLVDNRLTEVPRGFCDPLGKLRVLNVAQNRIQHVSSNAFTSCKELRALRLDTNHLEEFPSTLVPQLPSLLWLNVSENRLSSVDYTAIPKTVEWLDLSHNHLNVIRGLNEGAASSVPKLRVLDLAFNRLANLDSSIIPASLETLQLSHNQIKTVASDTFVRSRGLRRVELIGNQLESLPLSAVRFPSTMPGRPLPEVYLAGNPLKCDCTMEWLTKTRDLATTTRNHPRIVDVDSITCSSKLGNVTLAVRDAESSDFMCTYTSHCFATCLCCDFEACDCAMSCPENCTCYHDAEWTRNVVQCSAEAHTAVPSRIPMDATEIHLDGNHIPVLGAHVFIGKKNLRSLYLNNSGVEEIKNKTFNSLRALQVLHLEDNRLSELRGHEFVGAESIRELYLQRNLIRAIAPSTFNVLKSLEVLKLDGNLLTEFRIWELQLPSTFTALSIGDNPWSCQCSFVVQFRSWLFSHSSLLSSTSKAMLVQCYPDPSDMDQETHLLADSNEASRLVSPSKVHITTVCQPAQSSESSMSEVPEPDATLQVSVNVDQSSGGGDAFDQSISSHPPELTTVTPSAQDQPLNGIYIGLLLCCVAFAVILLLMLFLFRREIREKFSALNATPAAVLCCSSLGSSPGQSKKSSSSASTILTTIEGDKLFDAYFLYNRKDEDFLLEKVTPELESNPSTGFLRLCLHYRDLCLNPANPWNAEMITSACDASKRVVLLLSANFLQTEWANNESRTAFHFVLTRPEVQRKLVLVLLPPVQEENLINFSPAIYPDVTSPLSSLIMGASSKTFGGLPTFNPSGPVNMTKTSTVHWSDQNFWSKLKLLLPPPQLHPAVLHSGEHPMLIPATYTLSRAHRTLHHPNQQTYSSIDGHALSVGGGYAINYANQQLQQQLQQLQQQQQPPPVPPVPGWPNGGDHRVHPSAATTLTPAHFLPPFNESFKRHQQHSHHGGQPPQSLRLSQHHKSKKPHHHHHHHHQRLPPTSGHCQQDSTCSNMSTNSRRPLQASSPAGYSSSVETNLSSSNEDLEHVYSTLDSPQPPPLHHHHHHHHQNSGGNGSNASDQQLINPYSPCGSSNGGGGGGADPTMYFV